MCNFGLKIVISDFSSAEQENFDLPNLALKVSSNALFESGCKISMKMPISGVNIVKRAILA